MEDGTGDLKQVLQDVEGSTYDLEDITLEHLTNLNSRFYGPSHNGTDEQKARRRKVTQTLTNLKRMRRGSAKKFYDHLLANGVVPSARTTSLVESEKKRVEGKGCGQDFLYERKPVLTPPRTPPRPLGLAPTALYSPDIHQSHYPDSYHAPSPPLPPIASLTLGPDLDNTRSSTPSVAPSLGSTFEGNITEAQLLGMLYKPNIIPVDLYNFERHVNGYKVNIIPNKTIENYECQAIMIWKQYSPHDIMAVEATIATDQYLSIVSGLGNYPYSNHQCVLIKSPSIGSGDKCEEGSPFEIDFPDADCKQAVMMAQANVPEARQFNHDLLVFPENIGLDNRVISNDDFNIQVVRSMPDSYKDKEVDDHLLIWHNFWIIAVKGTAHKKIKTKKLSIKEEKAAQRKRKGG